MNTRNEVRLLGHIGKDAEARKVGEAQYSTFSLATTRRARPTPDGEYREYTDWHWIKAWNTDKLHPYLLKGQCVHVAARLEPREFEDGEGRKQRRIDIVCQAGDISLCGARRDQSAGGPRDA